MKARLLAMGGIISLLSLALLLQRGFALPFEAFLGVGIVLLLFGAIWK